MVEKLHDEKRHSRTSGRAALTLAHGDELTVVLTVYEGGNYRLRIIGRLTLRLSLVADCVHCIIFTSSQGAVERSPWSKVTQVAFTI